MATQRRASRAKKTAPTRRDPQAEWKETMSRAWLAGLGVLSQAGAKGREMLDDLAEGGPELREMGRKGMETAKETVGRASDQARLVAGDAMRKLESMVDDKVASALDRVGVPSRDEIRNLSRRVADLTAKVEKLRPSTSTRARR